MLPSSLHDRRTRSRNPPTGRLGIFHGESSNIAKGRDLKDPQPAGWGIAGSRRAFPVGRSESTPTFRLGDSFCVSHSLSAGGIL
jgi:hypothetical protein